MSSLMPPQMMQARGGIAPPPRGRSSSEHAVLVPTTGDSSAYQVTPEMMYDEIPFCSV